jgi:cytoskeletal protein CcmA (bactofilin family)
MVAATSEIPCITAREIVVLGTVRGNLIATDRLEIRASGSVMGDVSTARLKIEDGSYFQGAIEIRQAEAEPEAEVFEEAEPAEMPASRRDYAEAAW